MKQLIKNIVPEKQRLMLRYNYFKLRGLFYKGNNVNCPCCNGNFKTFLPYGSGKDRREQALCPSCHTMERHRLLWLYLERFTDLFQKPHKVLHFAPEPILQSRLKKQPTVTYISADLFSPLAMEKVDIMDMPYPDKSFDVVLCSHVLAHVPDDHKAMTEMHRVLKNGGWAVIQSRIHPLLSETLDISAESSETRRLEILGQADRFRNYGKDFGKRLAKAGFNVTETDIRKNLKPEEIKRYGLNTDETLFICRK